MELGKEGFNIFIIDKSERHTAATKKEIEKLGVRFDSLIYDFGMLGDAEEAEKLRLEFTPGITNNIWIDGDLEYILSTSGRSWTLLWRARMSQYSSTMWASSNTWNLLTLQQKQYLGRVRSIRELTFTLHLRQNYF